MDKTEAIDLLEASRKAIAEIHGKLIDLEGEYNISALRGYEGLLKVERAILEDTLL